MIRLATPEDGPALAAIYDPVVATTAISLETAPPGGEEMARRVGTVLQRAPWLVEDERGLRGYAYASKHRERAGYGWSVDAAVYVHPDHRRGGVGRRLYLKLFELLRLQGFVAVCAGVTLPNEASLALHESVGFVSVGVYRAIGYKLGAWHDVRWLQLDLLPRAVPPPAPILGADARASWTLALADR